MKEQHRALSPFRSFATLTIIISSFTLRSVSKFLVTLSRENVNQGREGGQSNIMCCRGKFQLEFLGWCLRQSESHRDLPGKEKVRFLYTIMDPVAEAAEKQFIEHGGAKTSIVVDRRQLPLPNGLYLQMMRHDTHRVIG